MIVLLILVLLVLAIYLAGTLLPVRHTAQVHVTLQAPAGKVWDRLSDFSKYPAWRTGIQSVERLEDRNGLPLWRETSAHGAVDYLTEESLPPQRMRRRIVDNKNFGGAWTMELKERGGTTELEITEEGEVYNPVFRLISRLIIGHQATMRGFVDDLQRSLQ